jgi:hypothetical protein
MSNFNAQAAYDQIIQTIIANSYFQKYQDDLESGASLSQLQSDEVIALETGNIQTQGNQVNDGSSYYNSLPTYNTNNPNNSTHGDLFLTTQEANSAVSRYTIKSYYSEDSTGLSAILLYDNSTGQYILEVRDSASNLNDDGIAQGALEATQSTGFNLAQINSLNNWYQSLITNNTIPNNASVSIGGSGLGGEAALALSTIHSGSFNQINVQNAIGLGSFGTDTNPTSATYSTDMNNMVSDYNNYINSPQNLFNQIFSDFFTNHNNNDLLTALKEISNMGVDSSGNFYISTNDPLSSLPSSTQTIIADITNDLHALYNNGVSYNQLIGAVGEVLDDSNENSITFDTPSYSGDGYSVYNDPYYQLVSNFIQNDYDTSLYNPKNITGDGQFTDGINGTINTGIYSSNVNDLLGNSIKNPYNTGKDSSYLATDGINPNIDNVFTEAQSVNVDKISFKPVNILETIANPYANPIGNDSAHSDTLLTESLRAMMVLQDIDSGLTLQNMNDLLSASANQSAVYHLSDAKLTPAEINLEAENTTIANLMSALAKILVNPNQTPLSITSAPGEFSEKNTQDQILTLEQSVDNALGGGNYSIVSLYNYQSGVAANKSIMSVSDIVAKAMEDTAEGAAYRYALEQFNPFVLIGADYTNFNVALGVHSQTWYTQRAMLLTDVIAQNVNNTGEYFSLGQSEVYDITNSVNTAYNFVSESNYTNYANNQYDMSVLAPSASTVKSTVSSTATNSIADNSTKGNVIFGSDSTNAYNGTNYNDYIFTGNGTNSISLLNEVGSSSTKQYLKDTFSQDTVFNGVDYVETGTGTNTINVGDGEVNFNLKGTTYINNSTGNGSITFDGELLTGGTWNASLSAYVDNTNSDITYQYKNVNGMDYLVVSNSDTQDKIYISFSQSLGTPANIKGTLLGLNLIQPSGTAISDPGIDISAGTNSNIFTSNSTPTTVGLVNGATYLNSLPSEVVSFNQTQANTTFYRNGNDLYLFDTVNNTSLELTGYFQNVTVYVNNSGNISTQTRNAYDSITFSDGTSTSIYPLDSTTPLTVAQSYNLASLYSQVNSSGNTVSNTVNLRDYDTLLIPENLVALGLTLEKNGNDLELVSLTNSKALPLIFKDYFAINQNETHIYYEDELGNKLGEVAQSDLGKYFVLSSNQDSTINLNTSSNTYQAGMGLSLNNTISGNSNSSGNDDNSVQNSYLYGNGNYNLMPTTNTTPINNTLNGGSGTNLFMVSSIDSNNIINNFKNTDKIYINLSDNTSNLATLAQAFTANANFSIDGQDLVISYGGGGFANESKTVIKNYFTTGVKSSDSRIYVSTAYGEQELDLSTLINDYTHTIYSFTGQNQTLDYSANSTINKIVADGGDDVIIGNDSGMSIWGGGGNDTITGGGGSNTYYFAPSQGETGSSTITDYVASKDTINIIGDFSKMTATENGSDFVLNMGGESLTLKNFNGTGTVSINVISTDNSGNTLTKALSADDLANLLAKKSYSTPTIANGVATIDASTSSKDTIITSTQTNTNYIGSAHNDTFEGLGADTYYLSAGNDTYSINTANGVSTFIYNPDLTSPSNPGANDFVDALMNGTNKSTIYLNSVSSSDVSFFYNQSDSLLTIYTGNGTGIKIENVDEDSLANLGKLFSIQTSDGKDIVANSNFTALLGEPLGGLNSNSNTTYNVSDNIYYLGDSSSVVMAATTPDAIVVGSVDNNHDNIIQSTQGNNLLFGGNGNDSILTNSYINSDDVSSNTGSIVIGGEGNDNLYLGNNDIAIFGPGDGNDQVFNKAQHDNYTLAFAEGVNNINDGTNFAMTLQNDGANLIIGYDNNGNNDTVTLTNFWNLPHNDITVALTQEADMGQGDHSVSTYNLNDILSDNFITQNTDNSTVTTLNFNDIQDLMKYQDTTNFLGGDVFQNYIMNTTVQGISQSSTLDVLNNLSHPYSSGTDNNPTGLKI